MPPQKRTPIDIWRKQEVIRWIDNEGGGVPTRAVKHFRALGWSIDGGAVRKWWRARDEILAADPKTRRLPGAGRKKTSLSGASSHASSHSSSQSSSVANSASSAGSVGSASVGHEFEGHAAAAVVASGDDADVAPAAPAAATPGALQLPLPMDTEEAVAAVEASSPGLMESEAAAKPPIQPQQPQADAPPMPSIAPLTPSERAVQLLQRRYSSKLPDEDVVEAFDVMLDPMKARIFLIMAPGEQRDLWLLRQIDQRRPTRAPAPAPADSTAAAAAATTPANTVV